METTVSQTNQSQSSAVGRGRSHCDTAQLKGTGFRHISVRKKQFSCVADEINVPIALSAFRDTILLFIASLPYKGIQSPIPLEALKFKEVAWPSDSDTGLMRLQVQHLVQAENLLHPLLKSQGGELSV